MKPVFRCEYCNFMEVEEKVKAHEETCMDNYNRKSCSTCQHRSIKSYIQFACACGKEIPKNMMIENCDQYERKEKTTNYTMADLFGPFFGGVK